MEIDFATIDFNEFDLSTKEGREKLKAEIGKMADGNNVSQAFYKILSESLDELENLGPDGDFLNKLGNRALSMKLEALQLSESLYTFCEEQNKKLVARQPFAVVNTKLFYDLGRIQTALRSAAALLGISSDVSAQVLGMMMSAEGKPSKPAEPSKGN